MNSKQESIKELIERRDAIDQKIKRNIKQLDQVLSIC